MDGSSKRATYDGKKIFFTSFLYSKLVQDGVYSYYRVRKVTKRKKISIFGGDTEDLYLPLHLGNCHWALAYVSIKSKTISIMNSSISIGDNIAAAKFILKFLQDEHSAKKNCALPGEWRTIVEDVPQQNNGEDCGVFTCNFARYHSERGDIGLVNQRFISNFGRQNIAYCLKQKKIADIKL